MTDDDRTEQKSFQRLPGVPDHTILRHIGGGGYGEVWLARNVVGTYRAVKFVFRSRFQEAAPYEREFNGIRKFEPISRSHEGLVDILQIGRNDAEGYFYYVMELGDDQQRGQRIDPVHYVSKTLQRELTDHHQLPLDECLQIGLSLADALQHVHQHGLIHRDIKPSNVIFVNGVLKLADIGLVTEAGEQASFVGTPGFIPPEGPGTAQADIFSLGKVLYEITMGKDPRDFPDPVTDLASMPDHERLLRMNAIILKACRSAPAQRYQSAQELRRDLVSLQRGSPKKFWQSAVTAATGIVLVAAIMAVASHLKQSPADDSRSRFSGPISESGASSVPSFTLADEPTAEETAAGFQSLFNGNDLTGWDGDTSFWTVKDGAILASNGTNLVRPRASFLIWRGGNVRSFELRLLFKSDVNSGVAYRNKEAGDHVLWGYQAEIAPGGTGKFIATQPRKDRPLAGVGQRTEVTGSKDREIVEVKGMTARPDELIKALKPGDWNEYVIIARGNRFTHWVNGVMFSDVTDNNPARFVESGLLGLEFSPRHSKYGEIRFKNIRYKPLDADVAPFGREQAPIQRK